MIFILIFIIICGSPVFGQQTPPSIGEWREHLPYNSAIDVTGGGDKIWVATPFSLFTINLTDNNVERLSRVTGLNETGISTIRYDEESKKLLIAYSNSNIDIIQKKNL